jgi:hypothetical protein
MMVRRQSAENVSLDMGRAGVNAGRETIAQLAISDAIAQSAMACPAGGAAGPAVHAVVALHVLTLPAAAAADGQGQGRRCEECAFHRSFLAVLRRIRPWRARSRAAPSSAGTRLSS